MEETYKRTILQQRAKSLQVPGPSEGVSGYAAAQQILTITVFRPIHMLFTEPIIGCFSLYISFNFAVLYSFFAAFPFVFTNTYNFSRATDGLTFLAIGVGCFIGVAVVLTCDRLIYHRKHKVSLHNGNQGAVEPEQRLYAAMIGSIMLPIGLFWFAWTARENIHWISPILAATLFSTGNITIFVSVLP